MLPNRDENVPEARGLFIDPTITWEFRTCRFHKHLVKQSFMWVEFFFLFPIQASSKLFTPAGNFIFISPTSASY